MRELVIFFTKAMHTSTAARDAKHLFAPESWALTVQNGIGNDDAIAADIGHQRLAVGMTNYSADLVGLGQVATQGFGEIRRRIETFEPLPALVDAYAERLPNWRELYRPRR